MKKTIKAIYSMFIFAGMRLFSTIMLSAEDLPKPEPVAPKDKLYPVGWLIAMIILICVLVAPWIYLLFKYGIFRRLRVSFIIDENTKLKPLNLKKGSKIDLPEAPEKEGFKFAGWYVNPERTEEYIDTPMPDYNIKLYAKYEEI